MNPGVSGHQATASSFTTRLTSSHLPLQKPDQCPESVLNKIFWHAQMGFTNPYPQWAITEMDDD